jgi:hypothetical protein
LNEFLTHLIEPAVIGVAGFIAWFLRHLGQSVDRLNNSMSIYIERVTTIVEAVDDHEDRLRKVEADTRSLN